MLKLASLLAMLAMLAGCQSLYTKRISFENHPIAVRVINKVVDEETIEYTVAFRNIGRDVVTFDYTIADEPDVPHLDADGPNSGLIENLYPGAEVEVDNPVESMAVWVTLGTVTYGKKPQDELQGIYRANSIQGGEELDLPPL